jgi:hypothetical protein
MSRKKRNLKYLSQSVLLEESGLPRINTLIIFVVFTMVVSFITWSVMMKIDEVIAISGTVVQEQVEDSNFSIRTQIPLKEMGAVSEGLSVVMTIPGIMDNKSIMGTLYSIEKIPKTDGQGAVYCEAVIKLSDEKEKLAILNSLLMPKMEANIKIIAGNKSLFEYFLGSVFNVKEKAFKER